MTIPDRIAAARLRVANQIELDTARAKSDTCADFRKLAEWINRSFGQRARWAK